MLLFGNSSMGHSKFTGFNATLKSIVSTTALKGFVRRVRARKEMQNLQRLDNRMLKDIGLYRTDLDWAMQQSGHMDPLVALQRRRGETLDTQHLSTVKAYRKAARS